MIRNQVLKSLVLNDLKNNRAINTTIFSFMLISALLIATGALVIERLSGSLDQIFEIAMPPHFMQMHIGDINRETIDQFAKKSGMVKATEIQEMVNIEGANITYERKDKSTGSLSDSMMDNYFMMQNQSFDYLLDLNNERAQVNQGEVGVPVSYAKEKNIQVGDQLYIRVEDILLEFKVANIIRDAQMGSSLASSIRFLVNENDFLQMKNHSLRHEYIIAFRLNNEKDIGAFSDLYQDEKTNMPNNGVAITLPLIRLVNGIGDGLMSGVIILVSFLLMAIAVLSMRFAVLSTLEAEIREIGTLKAIGLKNREIGDVYKLKYRFLTGVACFIGAIGSFLAAHFFMNNISLNFGVSQETVFTYLIPFLMGIFVYGIAMGSLSRILKVIGNMTVLEALKEGKLRGTDAKHRSKFTSALQSRWKNFDLTLGLHLYKQNLKPWLLFIAVFFLATFSILMPLNMYMTMSSPEFTNYVGAAKSDVRMSVSNHPQMEEMVAAIEQQLKTDSTISQWHLFKTLKGKIEKQVEGVKQMTTFQMESGDYRFYPIKMDQGHLPTRQGEIALSALNASRLSAHMNDTLKIQLGNQMQAFKVVGVYQDITNGGLTAKIAKNEAGEIVQYAFFVDAAKGVNLDVFAETWGKEYPNARVIPVKKLLDQTLGTITNSLRLAVMAVFVLCIVMIALITVLFITLRMQKNYAEDAILLAIGFNETSVRGMYCVQSLISMTIGIGLGAVFSLVLGEALMSVMLSILQFGLTQMKFLIQPAYFIVLGCLIPLAVGFVMTWQVTDSISKNHVMALGDE